MYLWTTKTLISRNIRGISRDLVGSQGNPEGSRRIPRVLKGSSSISRDPEKYREIPRNLEKYRANNDKSRGISRDIEESREISSNIRKVSRNTEGYRGSSGDLKKSRGISRTVTVRVTLSPGGNFWLFLKLDGGLSSNTRSDSFRKIPRIFSIFHPARARARGCRPGSGPGGGTQVPFCATARARGRRGARAPYPRIPSAR